MGEVNGAFKILFLDGIVEGDEVGLDRVEDVVEGSEK